MAAWGAGVWVEVWVEVREAGTEAADTNSVHWTTSMDEKDAAQT
jgi:hypothetical protein